MRQRRSTRKLNVYKRKSRKSKKTTRRDKRHVKRHNKQSIKRRNYRGGTRELFREYRPLDWSAREWFGWDMHGSKEKALPSRAPMHSSGVSMSAQRERESREDTGWKPKVLTPGILPFLNNPKYKDYEIVLFEQGIFKDPDMIIFKIIYKDIDTEKKWKKVELFYLHENTIVTEVKTYDEITQMTTTIKQLITNDNIEKLLLDNKESLKQYLKSRLAE